MLVQPQPWATVKGTVPAGATVRGIGQQLLLQPPPPLP